MPRASRGRLRRRRGREHRKPRIRSGRMKSTSRYLLPAVVFVTGASVLIVEVLAVRVLSPYYGNTIFTVSSVISVILLALSVGYYAGGALADRNPSLRSDRKSVV